MRKEPDEFFTADVFARNLRMDSNLFASHRAYEIMRMMKCPVCHNTVQPGRAPYEIMRTVSCVAKERTL